MADQEPEIVHRLRNKLAIAMGFARLAADECAASDPRREDLQRIRQALEEAIGLLPEVASADVKRGESRAPGP